MCTSYSPDAHTEHIPTHCGDQQQEPKQQEASQVWGLVEPWFQSSLFGPKSQSLEETLTKAQPWAHNGVQFLSVLRVLKKAEVHGE